MKAVVIYESFFGNTEKIAQAIGQALSEALGAEARVETLAASQVTPEMLDGLDLLVIGSPTRGFRPTEVVSKLLKALPQHHLKGMAVAAFDTRILLETIDSSVLRFMVDKGGYAASTIAKALEKKGGKLLVPPEGFLVLDTEGPLMEGEMERAAQWARKLGQ